MIYYTLYGKKYNIVLYYKVQHYSINIYYRLKLNQTLELKLIYILKAVDLVCGKITL